MKVLLLAVAVFATFTSGTIYQNEQVRQAEYANTAIAAISHHNSSWETYPPDARDLSYKGRWDSQHISWW
jgi:type II secretory pathway pseudopilin PulG